MKPVTPSPVAITRRDYPRDRDKYPREVYKHSVGSQPWHRPASIPPISKLDPGVRHLVRLLWIAGFNPTDSGDGVSKPAEERTLDRPHVFMTLRDPSELMAETDRLHAFIAEKLGLYLDQQGTYAGSDGTDALVPVITLEGSYDPATGTAVMILVGIDDTMLKGSFYAEQLGLIDVNPKRENT